jgi:NAD(P)-dependent dehydrogenase (short-subunit alcohol dehydrogenase family)
MRLQGKGAIITAAASGMGRAGSELFAAHGARVAAIDIDAAGLADVVAGIEKAGGTARAFLADLSDRAAVTAVVREADAWLGGVDVLWNHAGMPAPPDIEDLDLERYGTAVDLNLTSAVLATAVVLPGMRARRGGSVVFTSSTSGLVGSALSPLYSALKSGVVGLVKGLAVRYAADGVRFNALCPGPTATPMLYNDFFPSDGRASAEENEKRVLAAVPMGRAAQPREIAECALWLASDESGYVTGTAIPVDGGLTAR